MSDARQFYVDPGPLAAFVRWGLTALIAVDAVSILSSSIEYQLLGQIRAGAAGLQDAAAASDRRQATWVVEFLVYVVTGVQVLRWIRRANKNLHAAGMPAMEFTPNWAVGWYFVPVANLWKPYQAMREIWDASLGRAAAQDEAMLPWWWGCWLATNALAYVSLRLGIGASADIIPAFPSSIADIVSALAEIGAALLLMRIVARVSAAQQSLPIQAEVFS